MRNVKGINFPSVYYIVLNWNQPGLTSECLDSLARQNYNNFNVVLVDNGSSDGSVEFFREHYPWIYLFEQHPNIGYSLGNNVGIDYALEKGADYIFLLNNDTEVHSDILPQLLAAAESDPGIGIVGPTMYYYDPPDMIWGGDNRIDWRGARTIRHQFGRLKGAAQIADQQPKEVDYIDTCAILVKRRVFESIGFMNGDYFINFDDLDLNVRASRAGYKILYVPQAGMWHKVSATMGQASPGTTYYMTRNALLFFWRHAPGVWKFLAPLRVTLRTLRTVGAWTLKPRYRSPAFRRRRAANLYALRDFFLGRFGRMGAEVEKVCYGG